MAQDISTLSGSAAKLLLAYLTCSPEEGKEQGVYERSGIQTSATLMKANKELQEGGFFEEREGKSLVVIERGKQNANRPGHLHWELQDNGVLFRISDELGNSQSFIISGDEMEKLASSWLVHAHPKTVVQIG